MVPKRYFDLRHVVMRLLIDAEAVMNFGSGIGSCRTYREPMKPSHTVTTHDAGLTVGTKLLLTKLCTPGNSRQTTV